MHILLLILKIIGGLLLFLLALLILLILIVLLVPVRYRFVFKKEEEGLPEGQLEAGWLLSLVNFHGSVGERGLSYRLKAGWLTLLDSNEEEAGEDREDLDFPDSFEEESAEPPESEEPPAEEESAEPPGAEEAGTEEPAGEPPESEEPPAEEESAEPPGTEEAGTTEPPAEEEPAGEPPGTEEPGTAEPWAEEKPAAEPPKEDLLDRISSKAEAFWSRVEKTADDVEEKIQMAEDFLSDFPPDVYVPIIIDTIYKVVLHLFPRQLRGFVNYGFDDPYTTGRVTSWTAAFYPLYAGSVEVTPDFTRSVLAGELEGKGRIRLGFFVRILIGLLLRKEVRFAIGYYLKCRKKTRRPAKG